MTPLVALPGMNCTDDLWAGVGLGDVLAPTLDEATMDRQVEVLLERLPPRFVLVGLSLGGIVAMALAAAAPQRVAGLCVMSTNAKAPEPAQRDGWSTWARRMDAGERARGMQESILAALLGPAGYERADLRDRVLTMGAETGERRLRAQLSLQQTRIDLRPSLAALEVPALVLSGDADAVCPPSFHTEIASALPRAELVSVAGGHLVPMEAPREVGAAVRDWRSRTGV